MREEGYSWDELYLRLRLLYIAYKNPGGFRIQHTMALMPNLNYHQVRHHLTRMTQNGELKKEYLPHEGGGGRPVQFYITKSGRWRVENLLKNRIYRDDYPAEKWRI